MTNKPDLATDLAGIAKAERLTLTLTDRNGIVLEELNTDDDGDLFAVLVDCAELAPVTRGRIETALDAEERARGAARLA